MLPKYVNFSLPAEALYLLPKENTSVVSSTKGHGSGYCTICIQPSWCSAEPGTSSWPLSFPFGICTIYWPLLIPSRRVWEELDCRHGLDMGYVFAWTRAGTFYVSRSAKFCYLIAHTTTVNSWKCFVLSSRSRLFSMRITEYSNAKKQKQTGTQRGSSVFDFSILELEVSACEICQWKGCLWSCKQTKKLGNKEKF